ncbi:cpg binding protein [Aphelenchoides avenae]|nr:cpg binding protein [Aphelenchus avenae]
MSDPPAATPDEMDSMQVKKDECDAVERPPSSSASRKQEERPCFCGNVCYYYTIKCEKCEYDTFFLCNRVSLDEVKRMKTFYCKLCLAKKKNKALGLVITFKESDDDNGVDYKFNPCDLSHLHKICSFEGKKCELRCICYGGNCKPTFKIQCHRCKRFCHSECINMTPKESARIEEYYCPLCCNEDAELQIKRVVPKKPVKKKRVVSPSDPFVPKKRTRAIAKMEMKLKREATVTLDSDTDSESTLDSHSAMTTPAAPSTASATSAGQSRAVSEQPSEPLSPTAAAIFGQYFEEQLSSAAVPPAAVDKKQQPCSSSSLGVSSTAASKPPTEIPGRVSSGTRKKNAASEQKKKKVPIKSVKQEPIVAIPYSVFLASKQSATSADVPPDGSTATAQPSSACSASVDLTSAAPPQSPPQVPALQSAAVVTADPPVTETSRASSRSATTPTKHKASTTRLVSVKVEAVEAASEEFYSQDSSSANRDRSNVIVELAFVKVAVQELHDKVDSLEKDLKAEKETTATLKELLVEKEMELAKFKKERTQAPDAVEASGDEQEKDTRKKLEERLIAQAQVISSLSVRLSAFEHEKTLNDAA